MKIGGPIDLFGPSKQT
jgi:DNA-binding protein H-NS